MFFLISHFFPLHHGPKSFDFLISDRLGRFFCFFFWCNLSAIEPFGRSERPASRLGGGSAGHRPRLRGRRSGGSAGDKKWGGHLFGPQIDAKQNIEINSFLPTPLISEIDGSDPSRFQDISSQLYDCLPKGTEFFIFDHRRPRAPLARCWMASKHRQWCVAGPERNQPVEPVETNL